MQQQQQRVEAGRRRPQHTGSGCCVGNWQQQREEQVEQELPQGEPGEEEADDYLV